MWQCSRVAEAAIQDGAAECVRRGGGEDMSANEEGISLGDGAATMDSSCSSRLLCVAGKAGRAGNIEGADADGAAWWWRGACKGSGWSNEGAANGDPSIGCRNMDYKSITGDQVGCGRNLGRPRGS